MDIIVKTPSTGHIRSSNFIFHLDHLEFFRRLPPRASLTDAHRLGRAPNIFQDGSYLRDIDQCYYGMAARWATRNSRLPTCCRLFLNLCPFQPATRFSHEPDAIMGRRRSPSTACPRQPPACGAIALWRRPVLAVSPGLVSGVTGPSIPPALSMPRHEKPGARKGTDNAELRTAGHLHPHHRKNRRIVGGGRPPVDQTVERRERGGADHASLTPQRHALFRHQHPDAVGVSHRTGLRLAKLDDLP